VAEVYNYKVVANNYREQVKASPEMTPEQKQAAMKEIAAESRKTVAAALGPKAFNHYLRTGQATWLDE
jgi:hypothetical protein